jgi:3-deoxy-D-manno-octulosonate 8-phosphate phosphatase (KDO 8-P phosphatase)
VAASRRPPRKQRPPRAAARADATPRPRLGARAVDVAAAGIRLLVLDVDGVLTDGRLHYGERGEQLKVFHVRDGQGIRALGRLGVGFAIISGRKSVAVERRARDLGIAHVLQGIDDKLAAFERLRTRLRLARAQCACVGDDTPDVAVMQVAGLAFAVADAHEDAIAAADVVTRLRGGRGAVREVCDRLVAAHGR